MKDVLQASFCCTVIVRLIKVSLRNIDEFSLVISVNTKQIFQNCLCNDYIGNQILKQKQVFKRVKHNTSEIIKKYC